MNIQTIDIVISKGSALFHRLSELGQRLLPCFKIIERDELRELLCFNEKVVNMHAETYRIREEQTIAEIHGQRDRIISLERCARDLLNRAKELENAFNKFELKVLPRIKGEASDD